MILSYYFLKKYGIIVEIRHVHSRQENLFAHYTHAWLQASAKFLLKSTLALFKQGLVGLLGFSRSHLNATLTARPTLSPQRLWAYLRLTRSVVPKRGFVKLSKVSYSYLDATLPDALCIVAVSFVATELLTRHVMAVYLASHDFTDNCQWMYTTWVQGRRNRHARRLCAELRYHRWCASEGARM